ncbi:MAG: GNAT family N-acetyltransferase, partial [Deltaproteobacteria bacterium]
VRYRRNQDILTETPPSIPEEFSGDPARVRAIAAAALAEGRSILTEPEAKQVLEAYGIPTVATEVARDAAEAGRIAERIGFPVALKILSPEVSHKSDVGGVALNLESSRDVEAAAEGMARRLAQHRPDATLAGFTVQEMVRRPGAHELIAGVMTDPVFGPVLLAGEGGTAVEVVADKALALPPLNLALARHMLATTRIYKLLQGYRDRPPADLDAICLTLVRLSQLIVDVAEIAELDINPLYADDRGVIALDARVRVEPAAGEPAARLAIRPYPRELEERVTLDGGLTVVLRPIRPEDEAAHREFFVRLHPEDIRFRFFGLVREMPHTQLARYTQIDYDREMAFIATRSEPVAETLGVARAVFDPDNTKAEFAIIVRSDMKGRGLGKALLAKLIAYCRARGTREMVGQTVPENTRMLELAESLGFSLHQNEAAGTIDVRLSLPPA